MIGYQELYTSGELKRRAQQAFRMMARCQLCPHRCHINRLAGELGSCHTGRLAMVSNHGPHFGEEPPLVGEKGSGTVFFTNCSLRCVFCQNSNISQLGEGEPVSPEKLAHMMLSLQNQGCHNINLVTPTHVVPQILEALVIAASQGLTIPLVYNTSGYDSVDTLQLLDGIIDIYMPDIKYSDEAVADRLSGISHYPELIRAAVKEMFRQVGDLELDNKGIAIKGLLVRHLVLPFNQAGTKAIVRYLAEEISKNTYINLMAQYRPCYRATKYPLLNRQLRPEEFQEALKWAREAGLHRIDGLESSYSIQLLKK